MKTTIRSIIMVSAALLMSAAGVRAADWSDNLYLNADVGGMFQQEASLIQNGSSAKCHF